MNIMLAKKVVDTLLIFVAAALFGSGLGMLLEVNEGIGEVHEVVGAVFVALAVIHVLLSREWILRSLAGGNRARLIVGIGVAAVVFLVGMFVPFEEEHEEEHEGHQHREAQG